MQKGPFCNCNRTQQVFRLAKCFKSWTQGNQLRVFAASCGFATSRTFWRPLGTARSPEGQLFIHNVNANRSISRVSFAMCPAAKNKTSKLYTFSLLVPKITFSVIDKFPVVHAGGRGCMSRVCCEDRQSRQWRHAHEWCHIQGLNRSIAGPLFPIFPTSYCTFERLLRDDVFRERVLYISRTSSY